MKNIFWGESAFGYFHRRSVWWGSMPTQGRFPYTLSLWRHQFKCYANEREECPRMTPPYKEDIHFHTRKIYITFLHRGIRYWLMRLLYWWGGLHWGWNGQRQRWWGIRDVWLRGRRVNGVFSERVPVQLNVHDLQNRTITGLMNSSSVSQKAPNLLRMW